MLATARISPGMTREGPFLCHDRNLAAQYVIAIVLPSEKTMVST